MQKMNSFGENKMQLFHGSKGGLEGRVKPSSRKSCDFGRGFYTGDLVYQPQELICGYPKSKMYNISLSMSGLNVYRFIDNELWLLYIARNRGFLKQVPSKLSETFETLDNKDVLVGLIADDSMTQVLGSFFEGNITTEVLYRALTLVKLGNQYVFKSQRACDRIEVSEMMYSAEDRKIAKQNRSSRITGVSTHIEDIKIKYRRQGLYFDELLERSVYHGFNL